MWFVNFSKTNCKNCYACVRVCPVNAIRVKDEKARIIKERCIVCGRCSKACPQNTKGIRSEKSRVKHFLKSKEKVVASIAPSFISIFVEHSSKIPNALKKLGFDYVEETISAVDPIIKEYNIYANKDEESTYITSFCPSVNNLIQKHYPEIINNLIPVVSPFICHGKMLKEKYGKDVKVVFIGSCLAKKVEAYDDESIDAVLTFKELKKWIKEEHIDLKDLEESTFNNISLHKRLFPIVGQPIKDISNQNTKKNIISVDGIEQCIQILESIKSGKFKNTLFEMSFCRHSCIGGSGMPEDGISCYERKENLNKYANNLLIKNEEESNEENKYISKICVHKEFQSLNIPLKIPSEEEVIEILNTIGKYKKSDELNCGSCGYKTCREKAVAVYNNMAEINMCMPFMREKSENITNIIFDTTPNMIVITNKDLDIIQLNHAARKFFNMEREVVKGLPILMFLEEEKFYSVKNNNKNIYKEKVTLKQYDSTIIQSIIWVEHSQLMIWIADDITRNEYMEKKIQNMKIDAINMAQKVINKQMTVAQEIASLLGETTAETKVTLTQLKNLIQEEEGNI